MNEAASLTSYLVFNTVAARLNLSEAAKELLISQPAVSRSISKLEQVLAVKLFVRGSRGVKLTSEGEVLYEHTKEAFSSLDEGEQAIRNISRSGFGNIRVGADLTLCRRVLSPALKRFSGTKPMVKVDLSFDDSETIFQNVEKGLLDVGLIYRPSSVHRLVWKELFQITGTFVCTPSYLQTLKCDPKEVLSKGTILLPPRESSSYIHLMHTLDLNGIQPCSVVEVKAPELITDFALSDLGIAYVTREFVTDSLASGALCEIVPATLPPAGSVGICCERTSLQSGSVIRFMDIFMEERSL